MVKYRKIYKGWNLKQSMSESVYLPGTGLSPARDLSPERAASGLESLLEKRDRAFKAAHPPRWYHRLEPLLPPVITRKFKTFSRSVLQEGDIRPLLEAYQDPHQVLGLVEEIRVRGLKLGDGAQTYMHQMVEKAIETSEELSYLDNLTRLANRRRLIERLEKNIAEYQVREQNRDVRRHSRSGRGQYLSIIVADIDNFKANINDKLGYSEGDKAIKWVADRLKRLRPLDLAARFGGEEFVVVCPDTSRSSIEKVAERIRKDVQENSLKELGYEITLSLGTATYDIDAKKAQDLLLAGFQAAYVAKKGNSGKNRVVGMRSRVRREYHDLLAQYGEKAVSVAQAFNPE